MRLDQALVSAHLCESRVEAQECIAGGYVSVNGVVSTKQTKRVTNDDVLEVAVRRTYVSRGGEKLRGAMLEMYQNEEGVRDFCAAKIALDLGSSTGGFTDFLLQNGVSHVDCVDVGTAQLHYRLRNDPRISLFENTDIRHFTTTARYDIIVADLSFIPLSQVLSTICQFGTTGVTTFFLLVKPQFEVGKGNTKKGIVKNTTLIEEILAHLVKNAEAYGMKEIEVFPCVIKGGDGNQEYFLYAKR